MASFNIAPPEKFSFKPGEWPKWIRRFEHFRVASELNKKPENTQISTLIYSMGDEADDILSSFTMLDDNREKYDAVKAKFEGHFSIERNVIFERAKLNLRVQKEGGSADKFITDLYTLILLQIYRPLLSRQVSQSLNLINKIDAINKKDYRTDIVEHCPKLFKGLGEIEREY